MKNWKIWVSMYPYTVSRATVNVGDLLVVGEGIDVRVTSVNQKKCEANAVLV